MIYWLRSPLLLKLLVGQHILNGVSVAAIVFLVTVAASVILGFEAGLPATLGAIAASIGDFPAPLRSKRLTLSVGLALALISTLAVQLCSSIHIALILDIGVSAFIAGLVTGYGRWALALSMQIVLPMVFVLGLPPADLAGTLRVEAVFAGGGVAYVVVALIVTAVTDAGGRRLMTSECIRELSAYLRAVARFYDDNAELAEVYGGVIRQQAAFSDQLQSARALLLDAPRASKERVRLAASIGILLDVLDTLVAANIELADLRKSPLTAPLRESIARLLRVNAERLDHLSLELLASAEPHLPKDHTLALEDVLRQEMRLTDTGEIDDETHLSARSTVVLLSAACDHIRRLERALCDDEEAAASMSGLDLASFAPRPSFDLGLLKPHLSFASPVFRFSVKLSLAMTAGAVIATTLSSANHGNWILLTIAVVMRASYGLTRQRRDDRVIGTLIGCLIAATLVAVAPTAALVAAQVLGLAIAHSFARLRYRIASTGASIVALLSLHLVSPSEGAPVLARVADTIIGAALAQLFSHLWPRWEFLEAPSLASRLLADVALYAKSALDAEVSEQSYRMARKRMIEAIAALTDSAGRMSAEPQAVRKGQSELDSMLVGAPRMAAHLTKTRLLLRARNLAPAPPNPGQLAKVRVWLLSQLSERPVTGGGRGVPGVARSEDGQDALGDEYVRLRKAAISLVSTASDYRHATRT
jgi:uncharacterized membrane protein YccC